MSNSELVVKMIGMEKKILAVEAVNRNLWEQIRDIESKCARLEERLANQGIDILDFEKRVENKCARLEEQYKVFNIQISSDSSSSLKFIKPEKKEIKEFKGVQPECEHKEELREDHRGDRYYSCLKCFHIKLYNPSPAPEKTLEEKLQDFNQNASWVSIEGFAKLAEAHYKEKWRTFPLTFDSKVYLELHKHLFSDQKEE